MGLFLMITSFNIINAQTTPDKQSKFGLGINVGFNRGLGFQTTLTAIKPIESLPVHFRVGVGYTSLDPGSSADARRIFINNATNGVPQEKAKAFDYRFDFLWETNLFNLNEAYIVFGPRYSSFRANFKYIGGNEDFDVTSRQFGIGLGAETHFKISERLDLVALAGLDYFFNNTLKGHDTSYSPDNDNVNPRNDNQNNNREFEFSDANDAINQPGLMPRIMLGIVYSL
ncbi:hypothetical protein LBU54_09220 [Winogradskyella sp. D23]|uniref:Outer membrane protein beta-barrel domain-containing protein n=2 Tax=Winogradskyella alexanderae TaxID=2877123 RepID=A0ABS7XRW5_9FLAO|nr:hypothetical protein [Winogradskyella alexanderae]